MPHDRFYIDAPLEKENVVCLKDNELHHLIVSRTRVGQSVELINGKGKLALATLTTLDKRQALLRLDTVFEEQKEVNQIILAQGLPHMHHLEWIVEKATELGVTAFWLFPGRFSQKADLSVNQHIRLKNILLAAVKQCGRLHLPEVLMKPPLEKWEPIKGTLLCAEPSKEAPFLWELKEKPQSPIVLFIGPESGFDGQELDYMSQVLKAQKVRLHTNILRTETASLAGLSLIQSIL